MKFYALTLNQVEERRKNVEAIKRDLIPALRIIPAIHKTSGRFAECNYDDRTALKIFGRPLNAGEICCTTGHILMLQAYVNSGDKEPALLIEDDAHFRGVELSQITDVMASLSPGVDLVSTVRDDHNMIIPDTQRRQHEGLQRVWRCAYGTTSQIVTRKGAIELLRRAVPVAEPPDVFYQRMCWDMEIYVLDNGRFFTANGEFDSVINTK